MADGTKIEWAEATWSPITGCAVLSPGCKHCYAMKLAGGRMRHHPSRRGLTTETKGGPVWNGEVRFNEGWLDQPLRWKRGRMIFVCAHADLFYERVPNEWIDRIFSVMALAPQHTFLVLTKRAKRMREYLTADGGYDAPNVWLGVSVEDQAHADERIPDLLDTPAAKRFISAEPLLGPIGLERVHVGEGMRVSVLRRTHRLDNTIDWVIVGGESGSHARPMLRSWARSLRDQCAAAGVAYFHKQNGEWIDADELLDYMWAQHGVVTFGIGGPEWLPDRPLNYAEAEIVAGLAGDRPYEHHSDGTTLIRVGKRAAGRLLDGRLWDQMPPAMPGMSDARL